MRLTAGASLIALATLAGCDRIIPQRVAYTIPTTAQADSILRLHGITAAVRISGNVVELTARQPLAQLQRGGGLWARLGPYVYVFSPATQQIFAEYPGVAAVRARTVLDEEEIASALLVRDTLREGEWGRTRALLAAALNEGTRRPSRVEALVRWGEQFTEYHYNERYVPRAGQPGER